MGLEPAAQNGSPAGAGSPAGRALRGAEVVYQRMEAGMAATFGVAAAADDVVAAEGTLPAEGGRQR